MNQKGAERALDIVIGQEAIPMHDLFSVFIYVITLAVAVTHSTFPRGEVLASLGLALGFHLAMGFPLGQVVVVAPAPEPGSITKIP